MQKAVKEKMQYRLLVDPIKRIIQMTIRFRIEATKNY